MEENFTIETVNTREQTRFMVAGYVIFAIATGLLLCRTVAYFLYRALKQTTLSDVSQDFILTGIFTVLVQILVCVVVPFLIYRHFEKQSPKQILLESNYRKTKLSVIFLSIALGVIALCATIMISTLWRIILSLFFYNYSYESTVLPQSFNFGLLLLSLLFTAILPAICEEFAMRGKFLTVIRHSFFGKALIVIMGISFGLFHQNIMQVLYTSIFGGLMAYLVIITGSIIPAMIVHFVNNGLSVAIEYTSFYSKDGTIVDVAFSKLSEFGLFGIVFFLVACGFAIYGILKLIKKQTNAQALITPKALYRPTLRESAFYIGAIVMTALTTILTFVFGV